MAANMQQMAGAGQMMQQSMRKPTANQLQQMVYQQLLQNGQPNGLGWQSNAAMSDRMAKALNLISNIALAMNGADYMKAAEFGCTFERDVFHRSPTKEAYDQAMSSKTMEFFKKRQANETNLQNSLNANAQAQAQAQAMMNMQQAQMGRGMGQGPQQGPQHMQTPMPLQLMQGQPAQPQQPQQMGMGMGVGMPNQAGRGMTPHQQMMGMPGGQNRPQQQLPNEVPPRLANTDKGKVQELAVKMLNQASDQQKAHTRMQLQQRLPPQQLAEFQAQGKDPLLWFYQNQAFQVLKANVNRFSNQSQIPQQQPQQQGMPQNPNAAQAAMMQQQHSQQSHQQRQAMMNGAQQGPGPNEFQFTPNMESIKDQQLNGLMAQQAGQMVVPASNVPGRNPTPQPMGQNMPNQQGPTQPPRPQQQQPPQQQGLNNIQQLKINQAAQQSQAQLQAQAQAQMKMQGVQQGMGGVMPTSQSPGMNTLNTPVSRPPGNMNPMGNQGMGPGGVQFGDQRFNQGIQRPNSQAFNNMLSNMSQEQRQAVNGLPPDKLNEVMRRWQNQRQEQMAMNNAQMNPGQMPNRPPGQLGQATPNMNVQMPPGMPQPGTQAHGNQMQAQMARMPNQPNQAQQMMDAMDLPLQVTNQLGQLPADVKKWRDLKIWLSQNNTLPPQIRNQLSVFQQKQFQVLMQKRASMQQQQQQQQQQAGQTPNMAPGAGAMQTAGAQMANQQPGMQRPMGNIPPQVLQVSPQELMHIRSQRPNLATLPDEQLRPLVLHMKRQSWVQQQQNQMRAHQAQQAQAQAQAQSHAQGQQGGQTAMNMPQAPMQLQQPPHNQAQSGPNAMVQAAAMQAAQKPQGTNPDQMRNARPQPANNRAQPPNPSAAQPQKNLKRPSTDENSEAGNSAKAPGATRPGPQQNQPQQRNIPPLTPQQIANLTVEQRVKYEQYVKMQMAGKGNQMQQGATKGGRVQPSSENLERLKAIGQEEQRQFSVESMPDIPMTAQEYSETAAKLQRIVGDMSKIGRGLSKWYTITKDDARAKMFFRTRLRILRQFADGEAMSVLKETFSVRPIELDQSRTMLESMAMDLAMSARTMGMMKTNSQQQQAAPQKQGAQVTQQQHGQQNQPAPLSAANLEKNTQALSKMNQQKPSGKSNQAPVAPTTAQPPFPFGATSPHGNPSYIGKPKDINLQLPARKKQKLAGQQPGQGSQGATPSPQVGKNASPEARRAQEPQVPAKPMFLCKESDCEMSTVGFPSDQALQQHVQDEHTRPRENPLKFVQENLALALGLEPDGSKKKDPKLQDGAPPMTVTTLRQGQTPGNLVATPASQDTPMKRSASAVGKSQDAKLTGKTAATPRIGEVKQAEVSMPQVVVDPWADTTIDPQTLMNNLGLDNTGFKGIISDMNVYRSLTPNDTPESHKDSGSSEPNSDISEGVALDIDIDWQNLDTDLLLDMNSTSLGDEVDALEGSGAALDPTLLMDTTLAPPPDWDDVIIDFSKPFQLDTSFYSMET